MDVAEQLPMPPRREHASHVLKPRIPLLRGFVSDVYRSGYGTCENVVQSHHQVRLNLNWDRVKVSVYCDEPKRMDLIPLGLVKGREVLVSNLTSMKSEKGHVYLKAEPMTDLRLGVLYSEVEMMQKCAKLVSMHTALNSPRTPFCYVLVRHVTRYGQIKLTARSEEK